MRIIKPSFEILPRDEQRGNLATIELAARTCYKTEDRITEGSAKQMVDRLITSGHTAMLEHGDYIFRLDSYSVSSAIRTDLLTHELQTGHRIRLTFTHEPRRPIILSGNARAWREFMLTGLPSTHYFDGRIDPVYGGREGPADEGATQIFYADLKGALEQRVHLRQTVRFTIDRGVSHEFVRNRGSVGFGFAQESSRFCSYDKDKFGNEITFIEPCYLVQGTEPYAIWAETCQNAESAYLWLRKLGVKAEEARAVLPTSTKTELIMTGTLGDWQRFFDLRALCKTGKPHPQAYEVAKPLCIEMANRFHDAIKID